MSSAAGRNGTSGDGLQRAEGLVPRRSRHPDDRLPQGVPAPLPLVPQPGGDLPRPRGPRLRFPLPRLPELRRRPARGPGGLFPPAERLGRDGCLACRACVEACPSAAREVAGRSASVVRDRRGGPPRPCGLRGVRVVASPSRGASRSHSRRSSSPSSTRAGRKGSTRPSTRAGSPRARPPSPSRRGPTSSSGTSRRSTRSATSSLTGVPLAPILENLAAVSRDRSADLAAAPGDSRRQRRRGERREGRGAGSADAVRTPGEPAALPPDRERQAGSPGTE